jgi:hypothetical protein
MSLNVDVQIRADDSQYQATMNKITGQQKKMDQELSGVVRSIHQIFSYGMHIMNLVISNLSRIATTEDQQNKLKDWAMGLQIAQTEVAIAYTITRGTSFMVAGTPWDIAKGIAMYGIAGMMQSQMVVMQHLQNQQRIIQERMKSARIFYEMYR